MPIIDTHYIIMTSRVELPGSYIGEASFGFLSESSLVPPVESLTNTDLYIAKVLLVFQKLTQKLASSSN
jgi:hypothetical protein